MKVFKLTSRLHLKKKKAGADLYRSSGMMSPGLRAVTPCRLID